MNSLQYLQKIVLSLQVQLITHLTINNKKKDGKENRFIRGNRNKKGLIVSFVFIFFINALYGQISQILSIDQVYTIAKTKAKLVYISSIKRHKVAYSHTDYYEIFGKDQYGKLMIGVDPVSGEIIRWVRLKSSDITDSMKVYFNQNQTYEIIKNFLQSIQVRGIPSTYSVYATKEISVANYKRIKIIYKNIVKDIQMANDFIIFIISGQGNVLLYSKVENPLQIETTVVLPVYDSVSIAKDYLYNVLANKMMYNYNFEVINTVLKVVYPNNYFNRYQWQWSDKQSLVWEVQFGDRKNMINQISIWVDANTKKIQGGILNERPLPELFGIPDQDGDIVNIWQPAFEKMQFNTATHHTVLSDTSFDSIFDAIQNNSIYIMQTHGDVTSTSEYALYANPRSSTINRLTPDKVPVNNLYYALISACRSGHDGTGIDFKDAFINQGALCYQGYEPYIDPDPYEEELVRYLALGFSLYDANEIAMTTTAPWGDIIINWKNESYIGKILLAPLQVEITAPADSGPVCTISAVISNYETARMTSAIDVTAYLEMPPGFSLVSGKLVQNMPLLKASNSWVVYWQISAPEGTYGPITFDLIVNSDNLGVAVHDFDAPYHQFVINFR